DDYVPKPGDGLDVGPCVEELLIPKIKLLGRRAGRLPDSPRPTSAAVPSAPRPPPPVDAGAPRPPRAALGVRAATGGPNALAELLPVFPPDWSVPILVVQHMPADFTARLAERLGEKSRLRVREGVAGEPVSAAQAWIAPGGYHLLLRREGGAVRLALN